MGGAIFQNGGSVSLSAVTLTGNQARGGDEAPGGGLVSGGGGFGSNGASNGANGGNLGGIGGQVLSRDPGNADGDGAGGAEAAFFGPLRAGNGGFGGGGGLGQDAELGGNGGLGGGAGDGAPGHPGHPGSGGGLNTGAGFGGAIFARNGILMLIADTLTKQHGNRRFRRLW